MAHRSPHSKRHLRVGDGQLVVLSDKILQQSRTQDEEMRESSCRHSGVRDKKKELRRGVKVGERLIQKGGPNHFYGLVYSSSAFAIQSSCAWKKISIFLEFSLLPTTFLCLFQVHQCLYPFGFVVTICSSARGSDRVAAFIGHTLRIRKIKSDHHSILLRGSITFEAIPPPTKDPHKKTLAKTR